MLLDACAQRLLLAQTSAIENILSLFQCFTAHEDLQVLIIIKLQTKPEAKSLCLISAALISWFY